jgi:hypothetical protein
VEKGDTEELGEKSGATLYEDDEGDAFAIKDDVLVVAGSREQLEDALERREGDDRLTEDAFEEGLEGLPEDALVKLYGNIGALLESDPETEEARKVEWVSAVRTLGMAATVEEDEIAIEFDLATDSEDLSDEDLPLPAGGEAPGLVRREGEIAVGLRNASQIFQFGQAAAQAVDPGGFGEFETAKQQIQERLDVSVDDDLFGQLSGDLSTSFDVIKGDFGARAELEDPAAFERTLDKLADVLPSIVEGIVDAPVTLTKPPGGRGLYELARPGGESVFLGVLNEVLVVSNQRSRAEQLAAADPEVLSGAEGAFVFNVNAEAFVDRILSQLEGLGGLGGALFTGPLGDLTGSMESSTDGLRGSVRLGID